MLYFTLAKGVIFHLRQRLILYLHYSISQWGMCPNGIRTSFAIICLTGKFHLTSFPFFLSEMHLHVFVGEINRLVKLIEDIVLLLTLFICSYTHIMLHIKQNQVFPQQAK